MRLLRHLAAIALTAGLASCVVPLATNDQNCASYCALLQGCGTTGAPMGDCNLWCSAMDTQLDHVGCKAQFDDATSCTVADATCQAASCGAQVQAFSACVSQFCMANPTDSACPSGS